MWFGDLVTMAWWDDLWLNESFATWLEHKITQQVYPEFNGAVGQVKSAQRAMTTDGLLTTRAVRQPVRSMDSLLQAADDLAYSKGASVLHMTEGWIGSEPFRKGVIAYLKAHADGNATAEDLWNALGKASGRDVKGVLASFLDQPGVPLVTVEPLPDHRARLRQTRFVNAGAVAPKAQLWQIPVKLRYPDGQETVIQHVLLTKPEQIVTLKVDRTPEWIHPSAGESGYYRWSVPAEIFTKMAGEATRILEPRERVGFLGNASALLSAGQLTGADYAKVLEAFASDPDPEVVGNVVNGIDKIRGTFFAEGHDEEVAPFVRRTLAPALARFGIARKEGESDAVTLLRPQLLEMLGDAGRDETVLAEMERQAAAYIADAGSVDPSLADTVISLAAIRGDAAKFEIYRSRFAASKIPAERRRFLVALAYFRDPKLVDQALDYVFSGPLRPQELLTIPRVLAEFPSSQQKTYDWATSHYDLIGEHIPADFMVFMPYFAAGCSSQRIAAAKTFFADPKRSPPGTSTELARVAERVGDCVSLDAREGDSVRQYARGH
jgi:alanyl aminopeptidase